MRRSDCIRTPVINELNCLALFLNIRVILLRMNKLAELAKRFLRPGTFGFGGPADHIAMMREEVVGKRNCMDEQHFLDLKGLF